MRQKRVFLHILLLISLGALVSACGSRNRSVPASTRAEANEKEEKTLSSGMAEENTVSTPTPDPTAEVTQKPTITATPTPTEQPSSTPTPTPTSTPEPTPKETIVFSPDMIPPYAGDSYEYINNGIPFFTNADLGFTGEYYSELDSLGRCGICMALITQDRLPKEPRGEIGSITPTGWQSVQYEGIEGRSLYNRCHLIGWQLTGKDANERNLITGTRYMNVSGMESFEKKVANFVRDTGKPVLYRATPVFTGENLLADGVLIEAQSVEDDSITVNVFCYNVQPEIEIDYATGESKGEGRIDETSQTAEADTIEIEQQEAPENPEQSETNGIVVAGEVETTEEVTKEAPQSAAPTYIANANTGKFHKANCSSVKDMAEHNKVFYYGGRDEVANAGYVPCKRCKP